jgi:uncharacterized membrane protein
MRDTKTLLISAMAGVVALGLASAGQAVAAEKKAEKCYGVVKAGKNDCQTSTHACAGQVKMDSDPMSWIYLPKGACEKIVGGSLEPKKG